MFDCAERIMLCLTKCRCSFTGVSLCRCDLYQTQHFATRMADIALPPPAPFLALHGKPPIPWTRWLQSFETFLLAVGLTDVSATHKKALLLHCLGAEGQRVLGALESGTTSDYDTAVELLNAHWCLWRNKNRRKRALCGAAKLPGESVQQYVANLRGFASTCKFGALQEVYTAGPTVFASITLT